MMRHISMLCLACSDNALARITCMCSTAGAVATHLQTRLAPVAQEQSAAHAVAAGDGLERRRDARIAGTADRWPGSASSDLSRLANACFDAVGEIPATRWPLNDDQDRFAAVRYVAPPIYLCACGVRVTLTENIY